MKKATLVLSLLIVVAILVSACTVAPTPAPAAAPQPAAEQAAAGPAGWCKDVKIVFFPGGPAGGVFANNVYNGAKQAQADLGADVQYVFSDWDPQKMIQQFQEAAATKPDGIAVMGHPGDDAFSPLIDEAEKNGIIVTSQNTELPASFAQVPEQRLRLRRRSQLHRRLQPGQRSRQAFRPEVGRPGHGLGPAVAALAR